MLVWIISLASIVAMLVRPRRIGEAWWIGAGAILLVATRLVSFHRAAHAVRDGLDVYLFLAGMMILAELAREEGVFDWAAGLAAAHARGSSKRLFLLIYGVGVVVTALLSNDATAVVLTPAVLAVTRRARVRPEPYLLACAFIANAASFVFPISNPANLVVFGRSIPPLGNWLAIFLLPSVASIAVTFLCLFWCKRSDLRLPIAADSQPMPLTTEGKLALAGLLLAAAALILSSAFGLALGTPTCIASVVALLVVAFRNPRIVPKVAAGVAWSVLPLVAGLFVIVEALEGAGLLRVGLAGLNALAQAPAWAAKGVSAFAVALLSNGMNNLPVGLTAGAALQQAGRAPLIAHAVLLGVDLGPNLSVTGSLATILWLIALRRERAEITAWEFMKIGLLAMPLSLGASLLVLFR
ncbi:MAG TPA: arsenic transporter [Terracidiphilus sp.]|nr:arsenic transporter [Terracidiphilus sp.]